MGLPIKANKVFPWKSQQDILDHLNSNLTAKASKRTALIVANSIGSQSATIQVSAQSSITAVDVRAGQNQISLVTGGVAALALAQNDYVSINLSTGALFRTQVNAIAGELLTLADRLPKALRASAGVSKVAAPSLWPGAVRQQLGIISALNQLAGGPLHLVTGVAFGGAMAREILDTADSELDFYKPDFVFYHLFENDLGGGTATQAQLLAAVDEAVEQASRHGARAAIFLCQPSTFILAARAAAYDAVNAYISGLSARTGGVHVGIDAATLYLDTSNGTSPRSPLAGWTDNVHPAAAYRYRIAKYALDTFKSFVGSLAKTPGLFGPNINLNGAGGTNSGLQGGSVVPASTIITAQAGVTATTSKNADDTLRVQGSIPGVANVTTTQLTITQTQVIPRSWTADTYVKLVFRIRIRDVTDIDMIQAAISVTGGTVAADYREAGSISKVDLVGQELTVESNAIPMLDVAKTDIVGGLYIRPVTGATGTVAFDFDVVEFGFVTCKKQMRLAQRFLIN